ncbi:hypothetical protein BGZ80_010294 [Entomortierella chlamydospora]|uniref:RRM domain-containing protein n=1 Tax=Entomortierella chlamydospora TaxID=101097 RepID=A0A9P6N4A6_9FUNG|nr:hypothetical protein BGZ80_010294 [Entomortierella chlamydospora]
MSEQTFTDSDTRGRDGSPASSRSRSPRPRSRSPARTSNANDNANDDATNPGNNLFVNSLSAKTEASDLEDLFGKYGKVEKVQIMYDPHSRESRGFAFVTMVRSEDAEAAMQVLNGFELHGRAMSVKLANRRVGDRFDPRYDSRGPEPRDYRGGPMRGDYARPGPYDRWMGGGRPRYDDRPPRDYRPSYGMDRGYDDRSAYDRGYDRRPRYDERYDRY